MICRIWHGWTTLENTDAYEAVVRGQVIPGIEATRRVPDGNVVRQHRLDQGVRWRGLLDQPCACGRPGRPEPARRTLNPLSDDRSATAAPDRTSVTGLP